MPTIVQERPFPSDDISLREDPLTDVSTDSIEQDCLPARRWTRAEYHAMGEAGIFGMWERVELIEGAIVAVSPKSIPHTATTNRINEYLRRVYSNRDCTVRKEDPVVLDDGSEPEPDVAVARGSVTTYNTRQPGPGDLLLIVEVSLATLRGDRAQKGRMYARASVPEYWLVNLPERLIEVYRDPGLLNGEFAYRSVTLVTEDQTVSPIDAPDADLAVRDLLP